jgi:hypothetical protein
MVVVVDATGSMTLMRTDPDNPTGPQIQRFELARRLAAKRVNDAATVDPLGLAGGVQVFTFSGNSVTPWSATGPSATPVVLTPGQARSTILNNIAVTLARTALADSICSTATTAGNSGTAATTVRFLEVYSDGGENNSIGADCSGPYAETPEFPWTLDSWERKTYDFVTTRVPELSTVRGNFTLLFDDVTALTAQIQPAGAISDAAASAMARAGHVPSLAASGPPSDNAFFAQLAVGLNGTYTEIADTQTVLPVVADIDGNSVVDRNDALRLARNFGGPAIATLDLNQDGKVGFGDYAILKALLGTGTGTPAPDPYTASPTITCSGAKTVTIDGKVIEDAGITIHGNGSCRVIIRNSLIVSGAAAIRVRGSTELVIDNTIIVGEAKWLDARGATVLSAANSVLHGQQDVNGAFAYIDRGGNTFEH